jgi:hypothetical protein
MRFRCSWIAVAAVLAAGAGITPSASAQAHATKGMCTVPKQSRVVAQDSAAIVFVTHPSIQDAPTTYRYCLRSTGTFHVLATPTIPAENEVGSLTEVRMAGKYLAFVETGASDTTPIPNPTRTVLVDVATAKKMTVPQPTIPQGVYFPGAGQNLALSASGVLAATGTSYSNTNDEGFTPEAEYVLGFQASTETSAILTIAAPNAIGNLAIYECSAQCSATTADVIGWTSNGTAQYASPAG